MKNHRLKQNLGYFSLLKYISNLEYYVRNVLGDQQSVVDGASRNLSLADTQDIPQNSLGPMKEYL